MTNPQTIQYALMCLEVLDKSAPSAMSATEVARRQGVPFDVCRRLLQCFAKAGIVKVDDAGTFALERPASELTALEILEALSVSEEKRPAFRLLFGPKRGSSLKRTLRAAGRWMPPVQTAEG